MSSKEKETRQETIEVLTLEEALQRLEAITEQMEKETLALADMMALYKEGKMLREHCEKLLDVAEKEIIRLEQGEVPSHDGLDEE